MCFRIRDESVQTDNDWRQRIGKEEARLERPGAMPDPFAHSLSTMLSAPSKALPPAKPQSQLSAPASRVSGASSRGSGAYGRVAAAAPAASQLSAPPAKTSSQLSAPRSKAASELSVRSSHYSNRTPSTIRTDDPSAIARNKIAELELRLELERVVRLERENELEAQRRQTLEAESKLQRGGQKAAAPGPPGRKPGLRRGRALEVGRTSSRWSAEG